MSDQYAPAIAALERRLADIERNANELRAAINVLCAEGGLPPRYPDGGGSGKPSGDSITQIKPDTFYGKRQSTAIREYLELRKAQGSGPAKPREIFDALKQGGYQFEAKDDNIALVGMRALLRKNSTTFHKLPSGAYGLRAWYPNAKPPKEDEDQEETSKVETKIETANAPKESIRRV